MGKLSNGQIKRLQRRGVSAAMIAEIDAHWLGEAKQPVKAAKIGRNAPCPCGSGRKYKRCCGRGGA